MSLTIENGVLVTCTEEFGCTEVTIPESVSEIAPGAFLTAQHLECIGLPDCMHFVPSGAFMSCGQLRQIRLYHGSITVTVELDRIHYFGQILSFICAASLSEKEEAFLRMWRGDLCLPVAVLLALAYDSAAGWGFIRSNVPGVMTYLIDTGDAPSLSAILDRSGVSPEQLTWAVDYAIGHQALEMQLLLSSFKNAHCRKRPLDDLMI